MTTRAELQERYKQAAALKSEKLTNQIVRLQSLQTVLKNNFDTELDKLLRKRYSRLSSEVEFAIDVLSRKMEALTGARI